MRKPFPLLALAALAATALSACTIYSFGPSGSTGLSEVTLTMTDLTAIDDGGDLSTASKRSVKLHRASDAQEVLYVSLRDYYDLISPHLLPSARAEYDDSDNALRVYNGESLVFAAAVDAKQMALGGSFYSVVKGAASAVASSSLYYQTKTGQVVVSAGSGMETISFAPISTYKPQYIGKTVYLPLGVVDALLYGDTSLSHFYAYGRGLFEYSSSDDLVAKPVVDGTQKTMGAVLSEAVKKAGIYEMPLAMARYEYDVLSLVFHNRYGLASTRGISSMESYFKAYDYAGRLTSADARLRTQSLFAFFADLHDGHTGLRNLASWYGETNEGYTRAKQNEYMVDIRESLAASRLAHRQELGLEEYGIEYSASGDTATIPFDAFLFAYDAYQEDGKTIKEGLDGHNVDSYLYLVSQLRKAKEAGVKRVIIDDSCNGGGVVGVMGKLLALISSDNSAAIGMYDTAKGSAYNMTFRVDSNGDGAYDASDVFGDDFTIYIQTSGYSFSCGNAFPFFAKRYKTAKVIGKVSGGGECTVGSMTLPSGKAVAYSSMTHIGYLDAATKSYHGVEAGVPVDLPLDYSSFYDLEALEGKLAAFEAA